MKIISLLITIKNKLKNQQQNLIYDNNITTMSYYYVKCLKDNFMNLSWKYYKIMTYIMQVTNHMQLCDWASYYILIMIDWLLDISAFYYSRFCITVCLCHDIVFLLYSRSDNFLIFITFELVV